jgi:hypothetical protein
MTYIVYEPTDEPLCVELKDGKIDLCVFLSNECNYDQALIDAMAAWLKNEDSVIIAPHFTVAAPVNALIDSHKMPGFNNDIDIDAKPIFDTLRAELVAEIARIDALKFRKGDL